MKENANKFNNLVRYAPEIVIANIGHMEKFVYGLDLTIAQDVMMGIQLPQTYEEVLSKTLRSKVFVKRMCEKPIPIPVLKL